jgi:hypothetical protein
MYHRLAQLPCHTASEPLMYYWTATFVLTNIPPAWEALVYWDVRLCIYTGETSKYRIALLGNVLFNYSTHRARANCSGSHGCNTL